MNILDLIGGIFKPAADLVDNLHTSDEEKLLLRNKFAEIESYLKIKLTEFQLEFGKLQASVINAEAGGDSWLQRNWRPLTMVTFVTLVVAKWLGWVAPGITEAMELKLLDIIEIGLGGYIVGRSVEKVADKMKDFLKKE